ncbi:MAG TPA: hypothetical protein VH331_15155 [Allosphingosinicella sp.]|jgi:hypothetical protein|nr:hypothetical protein [Allosphingosinicella sp.]
MDGGTKPAVPAWYWIVAVLAFLWEAGGCYAYLTQVTMKVADMGAMPAAQRDLWMSMPLWIWSAYAVAVWVGLTGALALLLRQRWARAAFIVSLVAAILQFGWVFLATPALAKLGAGATALPICIIVVGAALVWFAGDATRRGWLR